jgi:hypothetical protein
LKTLLELAEGFALPALFFASLWIILPAADSDAWAWALGIILLGGTARLSWRSKGAWPAACDRYYFSKRDALPDTLVIALPLLIGWWLSSGDFQHAEPGVVLESLAVYPLYALLQLSVFLAIPAARLKTAGLRHGAITLVCAAVFALAHAPNPLLMLATGLAMLAWAGQFQRGRNLLVLALVMGIAATGFRYAVPAQYHGEMRIGPDYIEKRAEPSGR